MVCFPFYNTLMHKSQEKTWRSGFAAAMEKGADDAGMGCKKIVANCGEITGKASFSNPCRFLII